jgi:spermidine/putrescine transport system ATP-binding protein
VVKPRVILFDEPIINLDFKLQRRLCVELKLLHRRLGLTFIYVTHSMEQAMNLADRILVLNKGLIEQVGTPQYLYTSPNSVFVANFVGELNVLSGELASISGNTATVKTPAGVFTGTMRGGDAHQGKVAYAVRPELIELEDEAKVCPNRVEANLTEQIYKGSDVQYLTQLPDGSTLRVLKKGGRILDLKKRLGQKVLLGWENGSAVLLTKMSSSRDIEPGRA